MTLNFPCRVRQSERIWKFTISSTWRWSCLIPSPFYCQTWLVPSRLRVTRTAGAGGVGKGEERSLQHPRFPPSHHTQTGDELTTRLSYYWWDELSQWSLYLRTKSYCLVSNREGLGMSLFIMGQTTQDSLLVWKINIQMKPIWQTLCVVLFSTQDFF